MGKAAPLCIFIYVVFAHFRLKLTHTVDGMEQSLHNCQNSAQSQDGWMDAFSAIFAQLPGSSNGGDNTAQNSAFAATAGDDFNNVFSSLPTAKAKKKTSDATAETTLRQINVAPGS